MTETQISILKYELDDYHVNISVTLPNKQAIVFSVSKSVIHFNIREDMPKPLMAVVFEPEYLMENFECVDSWSPEKNLEYITWDDVFGTKNVSSLEIYIDDYDYKKVTKPIV